MLKLFALLFVLDACLCANVLMIHPVVSRSHELVFVTIGEALALRGHNVTLVRFKGPVRKSSNLIHTVALELLIEGNQTIPYLNEDGTVEPPHDLLWTRSRALQAVPLDIIEPVAVACETLLRPEMLQIFQSGTKYDVAIVDLIFNECGLALVNHLGLPIVAYWPTVQYIGEIFWTSSVLHPGYVPAMMSEFTDHMNFIQRFINTMWYIGSRLFSYLIMIVPTKHIIDRYLPNSPHTVDIVGNISLLLINSDFTLDFARPISPNTKYIGCVQCKPAKPLPQDLEDFMQSSGEHGVIVFSLGATFSEGGMPMAVVEKIYKAFARCKQKVILKMAKNAPSVQPPPNVRLVEWLPQQDVLGHNKTRLFVTHCGMHGVLEAIYHGVPMVGIPIFGDQGDVLVRLQVKGVAYGVDKFDVNEESLFNALQAVLNNDSYKENAVKMSAILRDQPQSAMESALYWIEYVIRHRGANHLKSADTRLTLFEYLLVDVILAFILLLSLLMLAGYWVTKKLFNQCFPWPIFKWAKLHNHPSGIVRLKAD
ncbi:hypothetical protein CHUAL_001939 [Chamberlinius hualienensis]